MRINVSVLIIYLILFVVTYVQGNRTDSIIAAIEDNGKAIQELKISAPKRRIDTYKLESMIND